jgi:hypothetical protein
MESLMTDKEAFLSDVEKRRQEYRAKLDAAPLEIIEVTDSSKCPFTPGWNPDGFDPFVNCEDCKRRGDIYRDEGITGQDYDAVRTPYRRDYLIGVCRVQIEEEKRGWRCAELLRASGLVEREYLHTFAVWDKTPHNRKAYDLLSVWDYKTDGGLYLIGDVTPTNPTGNGTGKSYALHALTVKLANEGVKARFCRTIDFLRDLRATYGKENDGEEDAILDRYALAPVLLWDDLGKEANPSPWACEKFYYVLDERCRRGLPTVISSNFGLDKIEQRFGENHGPAIASRLVELCPTRLKMGGPDRRLTIKGGA